VPRLTAGGRPYLALPVYSVHHFFGNINILSCKTNLLFFNALLTDKILSNPIFCCKIFVEKNPKIDYNVKYLYIL
jgi:hypothetical protein